MRRRFVRIIDTHQHLWDTSALNYPWLDGFDALDRRYSLDDYRRATSGVDVSATVHVEANPAPGSEVAEVKRLTSISEREGLIGAIVAAAALEEDNAEDTLKQFSDYPLVVAVRRMAWHRQDPNFYRTPSLIEGVQALQSYGLGFDLCAHAGQMPAALALVRETPDVPIAVNHCGGPDIAGNNFEPWADAMSEMASFSNTTCKVSGIITRAAEGWTREDLKPYIDHLVTAFGFDRLMFGSDWPVCTLAGDYGRWFDALQWAVQDADESDQQKLFYSTAAHFYRVATP